MIGAPAGRLHTARSRNDQVATDFRLWVRDAIDRLDRQIMALQAALIAQAEKHMPQRSCPASPICRSGSR